MNILHYALGFPPYRTGGLTKFCVDLMKQQVASGHEVSMLWPGEIYRLCGRTRIKCRGQISGINSFEVINPTPVSFDEGITKIDLFLHRGDTAAYRDFLQHLRPDVLHIHTLMGIHKSLLDTAKSLNIRIVFTAHDFFPICPKVTMFRNGQICENIENCDQCALCNTTALSMLKIKILQSGIYRTFKDVSVVKKLRRQHRDNFLSEKTSTVNAEGYTDRTATEYLRLRTYYKGLVEMADVIHYNSTITQNAYEKYLQPIGPEKKLISITHTDIQDCRRKKSFDHDLHITYLGPAGGGKGFYLLQEALDLLWSDKKDFLLNVYFQPIASRSYMQVHGRYSYDQLEEIFENTDVLIAPSILYETFGYTVLEALCHGVPVIVSDTVGAKDIIPNGAGIVVKNITASKLAETIGRLNSDTLQQMNNTLLTNLKIMTIEEMSKQVMHMYTPVL